MEKMMVTQALDERFPALHTLATPGAVRQIPFIQQLSATACGAACLAMVLAFYGKHVPISDVRDMTGVNRDGVSARALMQTARWYGLRGRGVRLELEALPYLDKGAILFMASPALGALVVLLGMLQAGVFLLSYRRHQELMSQDLQAQAKAQSYLVHMLAGIETLKAGGLEDRAVEQWSHLFVDELNVALKRGRLSAFVEALMSTLRMGSPVLVLWFGGLQALHGSLGVGAMLALSAVASGVLSPIATLIATALQLQLLRSYIERLEGVLQAAPEQAKHRVSRAPRLSGTIELEKVSFSYGPLAPVGVCNVSVQITPGQTVVGRCLAGSVSGSRWPGRSCTTPPSCYSTRLPVPWTPSPNRKCTSVLRHCAVRAS
jgi:ABC-type bacteriocin/lantibiotic exporter with double-glycine peptidase domain